MLKPKKKVKRQDLKEDKFVRTTLQVKTYFDENYRQVMTIVGVVFAVVVILILYNQLQKRTGQEAQAQLGIAQIEFSNGDYDKAARRLETLINEYGGTDEADQGMLLMANIAFIQKDYETAATYFEQFVDSYSGSEILLASGYAGLAACREISGDYAEAGSLYERAGDLAPDFSEADNYLYLSGICYKKAGMTDQAIELMRRVAESERISNRKNDAETQLILMGASRS